MDISIGQEEQITKDYFSYLGYDTRSNDALFTHSTEQIKSVIVKGSEYFYDPMGVNKKLIIRKDLNDFVIPIKNDIIRKRNTEIRNRK